MKFSEPKYDELLQHLVDNEAIVYMGIERLINAMSKEEYNRIPIVAKDDDTARVILRYGIVFTKDVGGGWYDRLYFLGNIIRREPKAFNTN